MYREREIYRPSSCRFPILRSTIGCGLMGSTLMGSLQKYYLLTDLNKY